MKKAILTALLLSTSISMVGCGTRNSMTAPGVATTPTTGDPYGTGTGTGYTPTTGSDPYGTGAGTGYAPTTGSDPYGTGAGTGYGQQPAYGQQQPAYGQQQPAYGQQPGYNNGQMGGGQYVIDPATGQPVIDPMTGQPMISNGLSQQLMTKIQAAGGYKGSKADSEVVTFLKSNSVQQVFGAAPLTDRAMAIKSLLDGWCTAEEKNLAQQIWNTIQPQDQQRVLGQDADLSKLVTSKLLQGKSNGVGSILTEIGKMVGLGG